MGRVQVNRAGNFSENRSPGIIFQKLEKVLCVEVEENGGRFG